MIEEGADGLAGVDPSCCFTKRGSDTDHLQLGCGARDLDRHTIGTHDLGDIWMPFERATT